VKQEKATTFFRTEDIAKKWYLIDAEGQVLGRLASKVARIIRGKDKATFTPNTDTGDFVVVVNAEKVKVTGKRESLKEYYHYSGYPGGLKTRAYKDLLKTKPEYIIEQSVRGMLPKTRLGNKLIRKLKVYRGAQHPHAAQVPESFSL
jgi:large subunit ribosomal protein L13